MDKKITNQSQEEKHGDTVKVATKQPEHSKLLHFVAGGTGGGVAAICTAPLDVLKTRLQASQQLDSVKSSRSGKFATRTLVGLSNIFRTEGLHGLFRGLGPNLVGIAPSRAFYFMTYSTTKNFTIQYLSPDNPLVHLTSAAAAGVVVSTAMNPVWFVKTRFQLEQFSKDGQQTYKGYADCVRQIYQREGIRSFYKGLSASLLGITESASYFMIYERLKTKVAQRKLDQGLIKADSAHDVPLNAIEYLTLAGGSKLLASSATYPHEVVRTRLREKINGEFRYKSLSQAFVTIAKEEGARGLYGGMGAHLLRVVPNSAIMFLAYEGLVTVVNRQRASS
eukprot:gb/GECH01010588.1/.p1 GENE.gb/GECH01010588.1/~~gb/GECH01010588.1/.p1  ORF type:complete len:336 (+),score=51.47 gb/GECH01010588.1/:1-1008(+)